MIKIIVGTQTGTAEFVADEISEALSKHDLGSEINLDPALSLTNDPDTWLVLTSTHGAGEIPDNLKPFFEWLSNTKPDLSKIQHLVLGIGDSSYDTYCKAAKDISTLLNQLKSRELNEPFYADAMDQSLPEDLILEWLEPQLPQLFNK